MPTASSLAAMKGPTITAACPSCGQAAQCESLRTEAGLVLAQPIAGADLIAHANCDLWALAAVLSHAALASSQIRVRIVDLTPPES